MVKTSKKLDLFPSFKQFSWRNPRGDLLLCALLDLVGMILLLLGIASLWSQPLNGQFLWICITITAYLLFGWLLGTYTVLGWSRLSRWTLIQRLGLSFISTVMFVAILRWVINPSLDIWLVYRSSQISWLIPTILWSLIIRVGLRRKALQLDEPRFVLVAPEDEALKALQAWRKTPKRIMPKWLSAEEALSHPSPVVLALSQSVRQHPKYREFLEELEQRDPRQVDLTTPLALAERQLERIPPTLLPEFWLSYSGIPWNGLFSFQRQLKRVADVLLSLCLLALTSPLIIFASLLIWIEDRGPVFYVQERSGWLGQPFKVWKLRTMKVDASSAPVSWTLPGDNRITRVGRWLRRSRLDELPQLVNVVIGEMSLIGPRPERPELELELEESIPHYRKRHWMRPGLSGWAQVCSPYAASIEDSELKLSYDLYYLKYFSTWLDLLILFRTIKTILKVAGR